MRVTTSVDIQLLLHEQRDTMWRQVAGLVSSWVKYSWKLSDTSHDTARSNVRRFAERCTHVQSLSGYCAKLDADHDEQKAQVREEHAVQVAKHG